MQRQSSITTLAARERQHYRVVANWVRRSIYQNTGRDAGSGKAQRDFLKYMKNPNTVDIAYAAIIERVQGETCPTDGVLQNAVLMMKRYLQVFVPSLRTLVKLEGFCKGVVTNDESILRTIAYVRALIAARKRQVQGNVQLEPVAVDNVDPNKTNPLLTSMALQQLSMPSARRPVAKFFLREVLVKQSRSSKHRNRLPQIPQNFVEVLADSQSSDQLVQVEVYGRPIAERINAVRSHILLNTSPMDPTPTPEGGPRPLFQYKYYKQQEPLSIDPPDRLKLLEAVSDVHADQRREFPAAQVLLKALVDNYCMHSPEMASQQILSIFFFMMAQDDELCRVQAFNMLFNLSVHINLLDYLPVLAEEESPQGQTAAEKVRLEMSTIQRQLYGMFREMSLRLFHEGEDGHDAWSACLNCLLYFVTNKGSVSLDSILELDVRVLCAMIKNIKEQSETVRTALVRFLANVLLTQPSDRRSVKIDIDKMHSEPGMLNFIIETYISSHSDEARENLFLIIFEYTVHLMTQQHGKKKVKPQAIQKQSLLMLDVLKDFRAPRTFHQFFMFVHAPNYLSDYILQLKKREEIEGASDKEDRRRSRRRSSMSAVSSNSTVRSKSSSQLKSNTLKPVAEDGSTSARLTSYLSSEAMTIGTSPDGGTMMSGSLPKTIETGFDGGAFSPGRSPPSSPAISKHLAGSSHSGSAGGGRSSGMTGELTPDVSTRRERKRKGRAHASLLKLSSSFITDWCASFYTLCIDFLKLEPEFEPLRDCFLVNASSTSTATAALRDLLHSQEVCDRRQGSHMLFQLLRFRINYGLQDPRTEVPAKLDSTVKEMMQSLLLSPLDTVKLSYVHVVHRGVMYLKARCAAVERPPGASPALWDLINSFTSNLKACGEQSAEVLCAAVYLLLDVLCTAVPGPKSPSTLDLSPSSAPSTPCTQLLTGTLALSVPLLAYLELLPLIHMFKALPACNARTCLLLIIIQLCHPRHPDGKENFRAAGGEPFFFDLVTGRDPDLAYHAARFYSEYIRIRDPQHYQDELRTLLGIIPEDKSGIDYFHVIAFMEKYDKKHNARSRSSGSKP